MVEDLVAELPHGVPAPLGAPVCQLDHAHDTILLGCHLRLNRADQAAGRS
jgi:hypothetical protein